MNLGFGELLLLFVIALMVFGPDKLPEIGKNLGKAVRAFRAASTELQHELQIATNMDAKEPAADHDGLPAAPSAALPPPPPPQWPNNASPQPPPVE